MNQRSRKIKIMNAQAVTITHGHGKGNQAKIISRSAHSAEVIVLTGRYTGREWTLDSKSYR